MFNVSGDMYCASPNQVLSIALYRNGNQLQKLDVRTASAGVPVPFSFSALNNMSYNDVYDIRVINTAKNNVIVGHLYFLIITI